MISLDKFKKILDKSNIHHPVIVQRHGGAEFGYLRWIRDDYFVGIELFRYEKRKEFNSRNYPSIHEENTDIIIPLDIFLKHYDIGLENYFDD